jgi:hypothetical protein
MWSTEYQGEGFNVRDGVCGVVTGGCRSGVFLELENGQEAFASFGGLNPGTKVLCTVLKKANERWRVLVSIDSVLDAAAA